LSTEISRRTFLTGAAIAAGAPSALRALGDDAPRPLRFVVYGDCRDGHDMHRKLVALMLKQNPDMVWQTGDLVHRGTEEDLWKTYDEIVVELRKKSQLYTVRGNHDFGGGGYAARMTLPIDSGNKDYYSVNRANCHFVALDVDENTEFGPGSDQHKWLVSDLKAAKGKARHIFVFFHVPGYSIGSHGMNTEVQQKLCPVFKEFGVRIVFTGHDHNYYHTTRDGVPYVVSGGGGAPLYDCYPEKGAIAGDKWEKVNHYCLVDVKADTVQVQAIRADGTLIEKFSVSAT
jgi:predicted phosphodiesterase